MKIKNVVITALMVFAMGCANAQHYGPHRDRDTDNNIWGPLLGGVIIGAVIANGVNENHERPREEYDRRPIYVERPQQVIVYLEDCRMWHDAIQFYNCEKRNDNERYRGRILQDDLNRRNGVYNDYRIVVR